MFLILNHIYKRTGRFRCYETVFLNFFHKICSQYTSPNVTTLLFFQGETEEGERMKPFTLTFDTIRVRFRLNL